MSNIYRYKLSQEVIDIISAFGKLYEDLPNKEFKEKWKDLLESKGEIFDKESDRLKELGYTKDVLDKIFKSCRYYYRKKQPKEKKKRRVYISCTEELLNAIDNFIKLNLRNSITDIKPSNIYERFQLTHTDLIEKEIHHLSMSLSKEHALDKIKKTFKNRCFILIKNKDNI